MTIASHPRRKSNPITTKEKNMQKNCKNQSTDDLARASERAGQATEREPVASDAERVANMPANGAARRAAWSRFLLGRRFVPEQVRGLNIVTVAA